MDQAMISYFVFAFSSLFTLVNPIGFAPVFLSMVEGMSRSERKRIAMKGVLTATFVLIIFSLMGRLIFSFFGITVDAFKIAGGILFFRTGLNMIEAKISRTRSTPKETEEAEEKEDIAYTPIGVPMIAGPGAITSVMILASDAANYSERLLLFGVIIITMLITVAVFQAADALTEKFGTTGIRIMQRIMGLILMVIAVQFVINGLTPIVEGWMN